MPPLGGSSIVWARSERRLSLAPLNLRIERRAPLADLNFEQVCMHHSKKRVLILQSLRTTALGNRIDAKFKIMKNTDDAKKSKITVGISR